ncbi:MAG: hypothetical protein WKF75_01125 [Singulisphaera sp.]
MTPEQRREAAPELTAYLEIHLLMYSIDRFWWESNYPFGEVEVVWTADPNDYTGSGLANKTFDASKVLAPCYGELYRAFRRRVEEEARSLGLLSGTGVKPLLALTRTVRDHAQVGPRRGGVSGEVPRRRQRGLRPRPRDKFRAKALDADQLVNLIGRLPSCVSLRAGPPCPGQRPGTQRDLRAIESYQVARLPGR